MFGGLASVSQGQGINIILNLFFGPTVNAARAIAYQIQSAVNLFINNFLTAVRPQVIKNYAQGNPHEMYRLTFQSARYSYYLMLALVLPLCYELRFILDLWLGNTYPPETYVFSLIVLVFSLTEVFHLVLIMPFHAIGKMKLGNSLNGTIMILALPISYFFLKKGFPAYSVFIVLIVINLIVTFNGWIIVHSYSPFSIRGYLKDVLLKCAVVTVFSIVVPTIIVYYFEDGWLRFFLVCILTLLFVALFSLFMGMDKNERGKLVALLKQKIKK